MNLKSMVHVFGEVLFDCFPDGSRVIGGAPFNVAWNLQSFGLEPQFVSRIGGDLDGKEIVMRMANWQMSQSALQIDPIHPTGLVRVELHDGEPHYDIVADSAYDFIDANSLPKIKTDGILYHGSLALRNPISLKALQVLKSNHQGKIFVDVNLRDPWWQKETLFPLLDDANWVKINEHELEVLCPEASDLESAINIFSKQFDLDILIVTLGEKGAIAWNKQQFIKVEPTVNTQVVDTVGAGDAFASVFLLGLSKEWAIETTLERAQDFAGEIVTRHGATINDLEFYQKFSRQWN
jgi:fructokinase